MLIDIHTHNLHVLDPAQLRFVVGVHSLGIHPWELEVNTDESSLKEKFRSLKNHFSKKILAIGECGLDRRREGIIDIVYQELVLKWHMDWALEVNRPLVIHCVKAEADLLKILKEKKYRGRILVHDFSGNLESAYSLLKYDCYFSFGKRLFNSKSNTSRVMSSLPKDKIFLETDHQLDFAIDDIYKKAQAILKLGEVEIDNLFMQNLKCFFSDLNDISTSDVINNLGRGPGL